MKRAKRAGEVVLVRTLIFMAVRLPRRIGLSLFTFLGAMAYRCYRRDRERALDNIARAFPGTPGVMVEAIARGAFKSIGRNGFDTLRLMRMSKRQVLESCLVSGEEHLEKALSRGRGVLAITAHIGCWEMLGAYLSRKGYKLGVIAKRLRNRALDGILVGMRRRHGVESYHREDRALAGYRVLRRGEILGMLIDQNLDADGFMVPFFGRPAWTMVGPAVYALRSGAAVVPMDICMKRGGMHQITILPEIEHPPEDLPEKERLRILTEEMTASIERFIRLCPQQWVWFHDRWRVRKERLEKGEDSGYLQAGGTA